MMGAALGCATQDSGVQLSSFEVFLDASGQAVLRAHSQPSQEAPRENRNQVWAASGYPQRSEGCGLEASAWLYSLPEGLILLTHWGSSHAGTAPIRQRCCDSINTQAQPLNYI